ALLLLLLLLLLSSLAILVASFRMDSAACHLLCSASNAPRCPHLLQPCCTTHSLPPPPPASAAVLLLAATVLEGGTTTAAPLESLSLLGCRLASSPAALCVGLLALAALAAASVLSRVNRPSPC